MQHLKVSGAVRHTHTHTHTHTHIYIIRQLRVKVYSWIIDLYYYNITVKPGADKLLARPD